MPGETVLEIFRKSIEYSRQLKLSRNPDDYWLSQLMSRRGNIAFTSKTFVVPTSKERSSWAFFVRDKENNLNAFKIQRFLRNL